MSWCIICMLTFGLHLCGLKCTVTKFANVKTIVVLFREKKHTHKKTPNAAIGRFIPAYADGNQQWPSHSLNYPYTHNPCQ